MKRLYNYIPYIGLCFLIMWSCSAPKKTETPVLKPVIDDAPPPSASDIYLGFLHREGLGMSHLNIPHDRSKSGNQILFETKCSRCHEIGRPLSKRKTIDKWIETTLRMRSKMPIWINEEERKSIVYYLARIRSIEEMDGIPEDQAMFEKKCSRCHSIDRPLFALKSLEEWPGIIQKMRGKDPEWISPGEAEIITNYLVENIQNREAGLHEPKDVSEEQALFEKKCSRCHVLDRPLKVDDFDSDDWARTVARMMTKVPDWINADEAGIIIDFLVNLKDK